MGCLTAWGTRRANLKAPDHATLLTLPAIALFLPFKPSMAWELLIYPLSVCLIGSLVLSGPGATKSFLNTLILTQLGAVSYSLYMSHAAVEWAANQAIRMFMKKQEFIDGYGHSIPRLGRGDTVAISILITMAVIVLSLLVYVWVESPLRDRTRVVAKRLWG